MWDYIIIGCIIGICAVLVGRKFLRQMKAAINPTAGFECGCGCSGGCSVAACPDKRTTEKGK